MANQSGGFMETNTLVSKVAFLILVLIGFIFLFRYTSALIAWAMTPSGTPHLIDGMLPGGHSAMIEVNPQLGTWPFGSAIPILRSKDQDDGIEFTWSVWVFVDSAGLTNTSVGKYKNVFVKGHKGNNMNATDSNAVFGDLGNTEDPKCKTLGCDSGGGSTMDNAGMNGMNFPSNAPGLYIAPNSNAMVVVMNTFDNPLEMITVEDIPLDKWVNVIIRCDNTDLSIYINGTIIKRLKLSSVPKQNYEPVWINSGGDMPGYTSNLWYWNYALGTTAIETIVENGPNLKMLGGNMNNSMPYYLSLRWFFVGTGDQYNSMNVAPQSLKGSNPTAGLLDMKDNN